MENEWKEFGYEKMYRVSMEGIVQSRLYPRGDKFAVDRISDWRVLSQYKQKTDKHGGYYLSVILKISAKPSKFKLKRVHRIVVENFIGKIEKGMEVDHIDGNRENNNLSNLRIVTRKENVKNATDRNAWGKGQLVGSRKISIEALKNINKLISKGKSNIFIAEIYKIDKSNVSKIRHKKWNALKYLKDD